MTASETAHDSIHLPARTVLVVGASGALGRRFAARLAEDYRVVCMVRNPARLPAELSGMAVQVADLRDPVSIKAAVAAASVDGPITGVVNAAGVVAFGAYGTLAAAVVDEVLATNATGVVHLLDAAIPRLAADGWIVNLSGVAAQMDLVNMGVYCASKAAASSAMRVAARELRRRGGRAIDVLVGHTETGLVERALAGHGGKMPTGHDPDMVVERVLAAIHGGETGLPPEAFSAVG